ncbi:MAG: hypothetical protein ACTSUE_05200 [Promethearchaeota archaeon]
MEPDYKSKLGAFFFTIYIAFWLAVGIPIVISLWPAHIWAYFIAIVVPIDGPYWVSKSFPNYESYWVPHIVSISVSISLALSATVSITITVSNFVSFLESFRDSNTVAVESTKLGALGFTYVCAIYLTVSHAIEFAKLWTNWKPHNPRPNAPSFYSSVEISELESFGESDNESNHSNPNHESHHSVDHSGTNDESQHERV